jgi:altronate dehydratase
MKEEEVSKKAPAGNPYLKVIIIDEETNKISTTLGMTDEKYDELCETARTCWNNGKNITDTMATASTYAKHANEFAVICFHLGCMAQSQRSPESIEDLEKLTELLKSLKGNLGQGE